MPPLRYRRRHLPSTDRPVTSPSAHPLLRCTLRVVSGVCCRRTLSSTLLNQSCKRRVRRRASNEVVLWIFCGCWKGHFLVWSVGMLHCFRTTARRRLLMQINNPTPSSLKRSFAQTASAPHQVSDSPSASSQPPTPKSQRRRRSTSPHQGHQSMSSPRSQPGHSTPGSPRTGSPSGRGSYRSSSFRGYRDNNSRNNSRSRFADRERDSNTLELPLRNEDIVKQTYKDVHISTPIADNPKNTLANFTNQVLDTSLDFKCREGMLNKQKLWRWVLRMVLSFSCHLPSPRDVRI